MLDEYLGMSSLSKLIAEYNLHNGERVQEKIKRFEVALIRYTYKFVHSVYSCIYVCV